MSVEREGDIHAKTVLKLEIRIVQLKRLGKHEEAEKLEHFLSNFLMYPDGPEGTVVYRKSVEKEPKK